MLLALGTGALNESLSVGPAGRGGAAAIWQTLVRISSVRLCPFFISSRACGGMPHQVPLSAAYLINFVSDAENTLNRRQASCAVALRSLAALIAPDLCSASARSLNNSCSQGG